MRVLEIGPNVKPQARYIPGWENAEVLTMDADPNLKPDIVADARRMPDELAGQFDGLLASHVLEHFPWWDVENVLTSWLTVLKPGGEIHIVVPSLEWAAREILSEHTSRAMIPHLYAGVTTPWDVHLSGYTMRYLRALFDKVDIAVVAARSGEYTLMVLGNPMQAEQHYVKGIKK